MNLGEKIYQYRSAKNLSQGDLADMLEVSRQSVSKWENGAATPDLDKIIKLSEIFGVTIDELVKGEEVFSAEETKLCLVIPNLGKFSKYITTEYSANPSSKNPYSTSLLPTTVCHH